MTMIPMPDRIGNVQTRRKLFLSPPEKHPEAQQALCWEHKLLGDRLGLRYTSHSVYTRRRCSMLQVVGRSTLETLLETFRFHKLPQGIVL
jgi:hypothetical protein